jgi:fumarate hydratase class II
VERNLSLATALVPAIGYDAASELAKEAARTDRSVREVARARAVLPDADLDRLLDPAAMTRPGGRG